MQSRYLAIRSLVDTEILVDKVDREASLAGSEPSSWNCEVQIVNQVVEETRTLDLLIDRDDCHGFSTWQLTMAIKASDHATNDRYLAGASQVHNSQVTISRRRL